MPMRASSSRMRRDAPRADGPGRAACRRAAGSFAARLAAVALGCASLLAAFAPMSAFAAGVVATRAIPGGAVIGATDVMAAESTAPGGIVDVAEAIGQEARITIYPGAPVLAAHLRAPALVERNALVDMTFNRGVLSIRSSGRALDRGALGERVRVMNLESRSIVSGVVTAPGSVSVTQ